MPDPPPFPDTEGHSGRSLGHGPPRSRKRRVRVCRTVAVVLVLLFVAAQVAGGGNDAAAGRTAAGARAKSHLDEARGHLNAILHLFD